MRLLYLDTLYIHFIHVYILFQCMVDGAAGRTGARAAPRAVWASADGTGVATHPGRLRTEITATAITSTMTSALGLIVMVRCFYCYHWFCGSLF